MKKKSKIVYDAAELSEFLDKNPNCVLRISKDFEILYKNKAVDLLLKEYGATLDGIEKILPQDIKQQINTSLKTGKIIFNVEADLGEKVFYYTIAPLIDRQAANIYGVDVTQKKLAENLLIRSEAILKQQKQDLEQKNLALSEVINHAFLEKKAVQKHMQRNVYESIMPIIEKIKKANQNLEEVRLLEKTLKTVLELEAGKMVPQFSLLRLSPREREICNFVKSGMTSKEISGIMSISIQTVEKHRRNIRSKLKVQNKKINLTSFLQAESV